MKIRYVVTVDDYAALLKDQYKNSPALKKLYRVSIIIATAICFLSSLTATRKHPITLPNLIVSSVVQTLLSDLFVYAVMQLYFVFGIPFIARSYCERGILGEHELEIREDGPREWNPYREVRSSWAIVGDIRTTKTHTFIYSGKSMAYVIPHSSITDGNLVAFLKAMGEHYQPERTLDTVPMTKTPIANANPVQEIGLKR